MSTPVASCITVRFPTERSSKLSPRTVLVLRSEYRSTPLKPLAAALNVAPSTVCRARLGRTFRWLP
jgi:hypothetical protein